MTGLRLESHLLIYAGADGINDNTDHSRKLYFFSRHSARDGTRSSTKQNTDVPSANNEVRHDSIIAFKLVDGAGEARHHCCV